MISLVVIKRLNGSLKSFFEIESWNFQLVLDRILESKFGIKVHRVDVRHFAILPLVLPVFRQWPKQIMSKLQRGGLEKMR